MFSQTETTNMLIVYYCLMTVQWEDMHIHDDVFHIILEY